MKKNLVKVRLFGSINCEDCLEAFVLLNQYDLDCDFIDAMADDETTQSFCDLHEVGLLPHLQFLLNDTIIFSHIGSISKKELENYIQKFEEE